MNTVDMDKDKNTDMATDVHVGKDVEVRVYVWMLMSKWVVLLLPASKRQCSGTSANVTWVVLRQPARVQVALRTSAVILLALAARSPSSDSAAWLGACLGTHLAQNISSWPKSDTCRTDRLMIIEVSGGGGRRGQRKVVG